MILGTNGRLDHRRVGYLGGSVDSGRRRRRGLYRDGHPVVGLGCGPHGRDVFGGYGGVAGPGGLEGGQVFCAGLGYFWEVLDRQGGELYLGDLCGGNLGGRYFGE